MDVSFQSKKIIEFFEREEYPCLMGRSVIKNGHYDLKTYSEFGSESASRQLTKDISKFIAAHDFESNKYEAFIAVFPDSPVMDELTFEKLLWQQLNQLHHSDTEQWDENVSSDANDPDFSFSVCGKAFYIIGMHPGSSRLARRAPYTTLIFNLHYQFEKLRKQNAFQSVKQKVRQRDLQFQGSINPMLKDFGDESEARQYSGRKVEKNWKCPFHSDKNTNI